METPRPLRSVLYVPGTNVRAQEKLPELAVDAFILDLEDAVAPARKAEARQLVERTLRAAGPAGFGARRRVVRVNGLLTPWGADDLAFLDGLPRELWDAVLLPKVEAPETVAAARARLSASPHTPVWCMIETPQGVLRAAEIAAAHDVEALVAGTSDLAKDLGTRSAPDREPLLFALSQIVLAARAAGRVALDGVCLDLADDALFEREARQGAALGFDGKTLIHPRTVAAANAAFAPDAAELAAARRIVAAFEAAEAEGSGVVVVDDRLVEHLHVAVARRRLALARACGLTE